MNNEFYQSMTKTLYAVGGIAGVGVFIVALLYLMSKKWFWFVSAGCCGLLSSYLAVKCIVEQRFLGALTYVFLIWVCWSLTDIAVEHIPHDEKRCPKPPHID